MARVLLLVLLASLYGCSGKHLFFATQDLSSASTSSTPTSPAPTWESMAEGYVEANTSWIFGSGGYTHVRENTEDGQLFDFVLKVGLPTEWTPAKERVDRFWGFGIDPIDDEPERIRSAQHVLEMSLMLGTESVYIPESCYVDLVDLRVDMNYFLKKDEDGARVLLYLEGADAGESYRAKFTIEEGQIVKREIWAGPFPEFGAEVLFLDIDALFHFILPKP